MVTKVNLFLTVHFHRFVVWCDPGTLAVCVQGVGISDIALPL